MSTTTIEKQWHLAAPAPRDLLYRYQGMSPVLAQVLFNRGYRDPKQAAHFLHDREWRDRPLDTYAGMRPAVNRIRQAILNKEPMVVYGDFDADGVTSTTLMMHILRKLGANAEAYIPNRVDEGYGLNIQALEALRQRGKKLVISVDCGIRSIEEARYCREKGLDLIITDHHSVGSDIPRDAVAVVNPQQVDCEGNKLLAGVGVAFQVVRALLHDALDQKKKSKYPARKLTELQETYTGLIDDLYDLVAIGTVADIMRLDDRHNRTLVRRGLELMNKIDIDNEKFIAHRPGLKALLKVAGMRSGQITAMNIGFALGPRINAAGRLESAMSAYKLLSAETEQAALPLAQKLQELNERRQQLTKEAQDRIREQIEKKRLYDYPMIFVSDDLVQPGIVGLVAGRLTEEFYKPTVVLERGATESRASCRSISQFHITRALDECAELLTRHGGHAMAAGLTVANENVDALRERLMDAVQRATEGQVLAPILTVDLELEMRQMTGNLIDELGVLEPTGHANHMPKFLTRAMKVVDCRTVKDAHLKLKLAQDGQPAVEAIGFRLGHWAQNIPPAVDVVYQLEMNEYNGRRSLQLNIEDIYPAGQKQCAILPLA
jgi:single-stranded-DNA-specific exonuclease